MNWPGFGFTNVSSKTWPWLFTIETRARTDSSEVAEELDDDVRDREPTNSQSRAI